MGNLSEFPEEKALSLETVLRELEAQFREYPGVAPKDGEIVLTKIVERGWFASVRLPPSGGGLSSGAFAHCYGVTEEGAVEQAVRVIVNGLKGEGDDRGD